MKIYKKIINRLLMKTTISSIPNDEGIIYLTFDDGPEPGITEFVLDELRKYDFKATFFCTGKNAEKYPDLVNKIKAEGHTIGNHTYSHTKAYDISWRKYVDDVHKADTLIRSVYFRPPNGCLTMVSWFQLRKKYKIIYWTLGSGDWCKDSFNYEDSMIELQKTKSGDIILFHFSKDLENGTRKLLPDYLVWLNKKGFRSISMS